MKIQHKLHHLQRCTQMMMKPLLPNGRLDKSTKRDEPSRNCCARHSIHHAIDMIAWSMPPNPTSLNNAIHSLYLVYVLARRSLGPIITSELIFFFYVQYSWIREMGPTEFHSFLFVSPMDTDLLNKMFRKKF